MSMFYWRQEYFETLKEVAELAKAVPEWNEYSTYCIECERGLRQQAFSSLERFMFALERAPFVERKRFVSWISALANARKGQEALIPHPLYVRIIEPTLLEWAQVEPECSEPHRWLGGNEHLNRAIELDPDDQIARKKLIIQILNGVGYATHHLPDGYLGKVEEDLKGLAKAEKLLMGLTNDEERKQLTGEVAEERELIEKYLRSKN